jgi:hypothetical protein
MPHKPWKPLLSFWATSIAWAVVTLFTLAANSNAQQILQPYASPILHTFLDSAKAELERTINHPTFAFPTSVARYVGWTGSVPPAIAGGCVALT